MLDGIKLKDGYAKKTDEKEILHIYPINGIPHNFGNCWCMPTTDHDGKVIRHNYSKTNKAHCENKK